MVTTIGSTQRREETGKKEKKGIRKKKKLTLEWDKPEKVLITGGDKGMNPANKGVQVNLLTKLGLSLTEERKKKEMSISQQDRRNGGKNPYPYRRELQRSTYWPGGNCWMEL